jgi:peptide/nickel transport system permease protein
LTAYIVRRLLMGVVVLILASLAIFFVMRLLPGDPLMLYLGQNMDRMTPDALANLRHEFGLDKPVLLQYFNWIGGIVQGDFGKSIYYNQNVSLLLLQRYPVTLRLGIISFVFSMCIGVTIGVIAGLRRGKWADTLVTTLAYFGQAVPMFWLGILLVLLLSVKLNLLPTSGYTPPSENFWLSIKQMIMPVMCYSVSGLAATARQMRSSILEIIQQDYIRTAWSKGLRERDVVFKHALKNSLIPVVTLIGMFVPIIFGGSIFVETVFSIPGIGRLLVSSIQGRDYVVVQSVALVIAAVVVIVNMLVEISYVFIDPRIRYK